MIRAWMVVAGATLAGAVGLGTVTSHGVLVVHLEGNTVLGIGLGALLVAVSTALQFLLGPLAGRLTDRFGVRRVLLTATGAYLLGASVAAVAAPTTGVLVYAVGTGIAGAATLAPVLATAAGWFRHRRAVAIAIVSSGNAVGAVVLAPWLAASVEARGLASTWAAMALAGGVLLLVATAAVGTPPNADLAGTDAASPELAGTAHGGTTAAWRLRTVLRDPFLRGLYVSGVLAATGVITVMAYVAPYAVALGTSPARAAALLGLTSAAGIVSRLAVALVPEGAAFAAWRTTLLGLAGTALLWILAPAAPALLVVFALAFGLAAGLWSALAPLVIAEVHAERLASIIGVIYTSVAIGGAVGPIVASVVLRSAPLSALGVLLGIALLAAHGVLSPSPQAVVPPAAPFASRPPAAEEPSACA
jgi:MFS family permease